MEKIDEVYSVKKKQKRKKEKENEKRKNRRWIVHESLKKHL